MNQRWRRYFGWSKSRAGLFRECRKRYSFHYIYKWEAGKTAGWAKRLSKLETLAIAKGSLVHTQIEHFLKAYKRTGRADLAAAQAALAAAFDALAADAQDRVLEVVLGTLSLADARARLADDKADAAAQLAAFGRDHWPRYQDLEVVAFEELERFQAGGHPVWVSADLVVRRPEGGLLLVDWKTGLREQDADESEQLTAYLLWAKDRYQVPLDELEAELVWFASGRVDRTRRTPEQLAELVTVIAADCDEMLGLTAYDQVTASPEERRCQRCNFLPLCKEGATWMDAADRRRSLAWLGGAV